MILQKHTRGFIEENQKKCCKNIAVTLFIYAFKIRQSYFELYIHTLLDII